MLNPWEYIIGPYSVATGVGYFVVFWLILATGAIFIRSKNYQLTFTFLAVGTLILSPVLTSVGGLFDTLIFFAILIGVTNTLYKLLVRGKSKWG